VASSSSRRIGAYSRGLRARSVDGRSALGLHLRKFESGLVQHCGGAPGVPVAALIDQAVGIELQLVLLEQKGIETDHDRRCYGALLNAKRLTLREIGLRPAALSPAPDPFAHQGRTLADLVAAR
jgi:hypothetical protein